MDNDPCILSSSGNTEFPGKKKIAVDKINMKRLFHSKRLRKIKKISNNLPKPTKIKPVNIKIEKN